MIEHVSEIETLDFNKDIALFSQTTKSIDGFKSMCEAISKRIISPAKLTCHDTICRQVANRVERLIEFAQSHESSNGRILFNECLGVNVNTYMISSEEEVDPMWLKNIRSVGICGATSTPRWLMEKVKDAILNY